MVSKTSRKAIEGLKQELRRGAVVFAVLGLLEEEEYGYGLREKLAKMGMEVSEGTLYPLLRRLENQGLLGSDWRLGEGRPRRYYAVSKEGREARTDLHSEWMKLIEALGNVERGLGRNS